MSDRAHLPPNFVRGSLSFASIVLAVLGVTVGFILTMVGVMLWLGLLGIDGLAASQIAIVFVSGLVALAIGYVGWRGFVRDTG